MSISWKPILWERSLQNDVSARSYLNTNLNHRRTYYILLMSACIRGQDPGLCNMGHTGQQAKRISRGQNLAPSQSFTRLEESTPCYLREDAVAHKAIHSYSCVYLVKILFTNWHRAPWQTDEVCRHSIVYVVTREGFAMILMETSSRLLPHGPLPQSWEESQHVVLIVIHFHKFSKNLLF